MTPHGVAAFDFDGTLARHDTLVPFLRGARGTHRVVLAAGLAALGPAGRRRDRDAVKVAAVGAPVPGRPRPTSRSGAGLRPDARRAAAARDARAGAVAPDQGHATVIVSASLGAYLRPLAEHLGIDAALAVELVAGVDGMLTGDVVGGLNTRGPHKVARLRAWTDERLGPDTPFELWAYGDSSGDEELLALADHPTWVGRRANPGRRTAPRSRGVGDPSRTTRGAPADARATGTPAEGGEPEHDPGHRREGAGVVAARRPSRSAASLAPAPAGCRRAVRRDAVGLGRVLEHAWAHRPGSAGPRALSSDGHRRRTPRPAGGGPAPVPGVAGTAAAARPERRRPARLRVPPPEPPVPSPPAPRAPVTARAGGA